MEKIFSQDKEKIEDVLKTHYSAMWLSQTKTNLTFYPSVLVMKTKLFIFTAGWMAKKWIYWQGTPKWLLPLKPMLS